MVFELIPLTSVGPVRLGMTRDAARAALAQPFEAFRKSRDSEHTTDAFFDAAIQVFYAGTSPRVEFIELSNSPAFNAVLNGIDVFQMRAEDVVKRVALSVPFDSTDPELGYSYVFPKWEVAFWRPTLPKSPTDEGGRHFATVGLGRAGYYSASGAV
jgi:hypothetical protein